MGAGARAAQAALARRTRPGGPGDGCAPTCWRSSPGAPGEVELWAWIAAYDHVALCQLWGPMTALPRALPRFTRELRQRWEDAGRPPLPRRGRRARRAGRRPAEPAAVGGDRGGGRRAATQLVRTGRRDRPGVARETRTALVVQACAPAGGEQGRVGQPRMRPRAGDRTRHVKGSPRPGRRAGRRRSARCPRAAGGGRSRRCRRRRGRRRGSTGGLPWRAECPVPSSVEPRRSSDRSVRSGGRSARADAAAGRAAADPRKRAPTGQRLPLVA